MDKHNGSTMGGGLNLNISDRNALKTLDAAVKARFIDDDLKEAVDYLKANSDETITFCFKIFESYRDNDRTGLIEIGIIIEALLKERKQEGEQMVTLTIEGAVKNLTWRRDVTSAIEYLKTHPEDITEFCFLTFEAYDYKNGDTTGIIQLATIITELINNQIATPAEAFQKLLEGKYDQVTSFLKDNPYDAHDIIELVVEGVPDKELQANLISILIERLVELLQRKVK
jgi:hypothetical protein